MGWSNLLFPPLYLENDTFSNYYFQENSAKSEKTAKKVEIKARTLLWWRRHWRRFFYMQWDDWREIIPCFAKMLASDRLACFCFTSAHFYISSLENEPIFLCKIINRVGKVRVKIYSFLTRLKRPLTVQIFHNTY